MSQVKSKQKIAVFFGGRSPEHDVSVVTGLQVMGAVDTSVYDVMAVYIAPDGEWLCANGPKGEAILRDRSKYLLSVDDAKALNAVTLDMKPAQTASSRGRLISKKTSLFGASKVLEFDAALLAFHGLYGEDGNIQGALEVAGVPYTGMRVMATSLLMDKVATKHLLRSLEIPCLDFAVLRRPDDGSFAVSLDEIKSVTKHLKYPLCLKPSHLGSSIGVAKVNTPEDVPACLPAIFEYDDTAILEPFVENMVEYNVGVAKMDGDVVISAVERPKANDELLDFKQKYLSGGDDKSGQKLGSKSADTSISEGMLSLTRELNPVLPKGLHDKIETWARSMFDNIGGTGAPRIDFISDSKTNDMWLNEVNPIPGSFGYFLWEAHKNSPVLFTALLTHLIEESFHCRAGRFVSKDPVPKDARLLNRGN